MEKTPQHLTFLTVKEGEIQLNRLRSLHSTMVGTLYPGIVTQQIMEVHCKLDEMKKKEQPRGISVARVLEQHYTEQKTELAIA